MSDNQPHARGLVGADGPVRPPAEPSPGTRERIVQVATHLFHERGYHAASLSEIAKRVGIRKASLYHHFPSKQALLRAVLKDCIEPSYRVLAGIHASGLPATEKLRQAVHAHVLGLIGNLEAVSIFLREGRALPAEELRDFIEYRDAYGQLFEAILQEGQRSGEFVGFDPQHAKLALLGMLNWTMFWYRPHGPSTPEAIATSFTELALRAVGARPAETPRPSPAAHRAAGDGSQPCA